MTYMEAVEAVEAELRKLSPADARAVLRELESTRGTDRWDAEGSPKVAMAAMRVVREHFTRELAHFTTDDRIAAYRVLPDDQPDPVVRCRTDAITRELDRVLPDVADQAVDRFRAAGLSDDMWPAYAADAYAAAYRPEPHDVRVVDTGAGHRVTCTTCRATLATSRVEADAGHAADRHRAFADLARAAREGAVDGSLPGREGER